jgi:hypothetical protein
MSMGFLGKAFKKVATATAKAPAGYMGAKNSGKFSGISGAITGALTKAMAANAAGNMAKDEAKAAVLAKLGLTADEVAALIA